LTAITAKYNNQGLQSGMEGRAWPAPISLKKKKNYKVEKTKI
jgi:hypothetical protein